MQSIKRKNPEGIDSFEAMNETGQFGIVITERMQSVYGIGG